MSWKDDLLDAKFRGVALQVEGDSLKGKRALARHGVPYRSGDTVEDLGRESLVFQLRAVFYGDDYAAALQGLVKALETPGEGELIHPIYGSVNVVPEDWEVSHDAEHPDYATVALTFVESAPNPAFFKRAFQTSDGAIAALATRDVRDWRDHVRDLLSRVDALVAQAHLAVGGGWLGLIEHLLGVPGIGLRLAQLRSQTAGVMAGVADLAHTSAPIFDSIATPTRLATELQTLWGATIPVRSSDGAIDTQALLSGALLPRELPGALELPALATRTWSTVLDAARRGDTPQFAPDALPIGVPAEPMTAHALGLVALSVTEQALAVSGAVADVLDAQRLDATMTPQELDRLTAQARALLQGAIVLHRRLYDVETALAVIEPLRNLAALLQAGARRVILARPPLLRRTVSHDTCLRALAHHWYGDHRRALELARLNPQLRTPYDISQGEVLHAYAV